MEPALAAGTLWVAAEAGEPAGFLAATIEGEILHIDEMDVRLDRQRRGIGRRLIEAALAAARARGLAAATLTTQRSLAWNAPFYAALGFAVLAEGDLPPRLAALLQREAAAGMSDRCAMMLDLRA